MIRKVCGTVCELFRFSTFVTDCLSAYPHTCKVHRKDRNDAYYIRRVAPNANQLRNQVQLAQITKFCCMPPLFWMAWDLQCQILCYWSEISNRYHQQCVHHSSPNNDINYANTSFPFALSEQWPSVLPRLHTRFKISYIPVVAII